MEVNDAIDMMIDATKKLDKIMQQMCNKNTVENKKTTKDENYTSHGISLTQEELNQFQPYQGDGPNEYVDVSKYIR